MRNQSELGSVIHVDKRASCTTASSAAIAHSPARQRRVRATLSMEAGSLFAIACDENAVANPTTNNASPGTADPGTHTASTTQAAAAPNPAAK